MKRLVTTVTLSILPLLAIAEDGQEAPTTKNYCHAPENKQQFEQMLAQYPNDPGIIKLYALREGLCAMIDKGQVTLETGIDIWDEERSKIVIDRSKDELGKVPKLSL